MRELTWILLASLAMRPCAAAAGPIRDEAPDQVIDDFERPLEWRAAPQNNVRVTLDLPQALGHSGQAALLVTAASGEEGPKGRNAFRIQRELPKGLDCSRCEGVQLWLKPVSCGGDLRLCLHLPAGIRYRASLPINPGDEGGWKFFRVPFSEFIWDFESAKAQAPKLDAGAITGLSLWRQMAANSKDAFYLDDVALYKPQPPYDGPTVRIRSSAGSAIVRPGTNANFLGTVDGIGDASDCSLSLKVCDYFGGTITNETLAVKPDGRGGFAFDVPSSNTGYAHLDAVLARAGRPAFAEEYSIATIPELPPAQRADAGASPFGIWVGGVQFPIDQGARWYRGYCQPWDFEPDAGGGYRYLGKGAFPPAKAPFAGATPIYFFRGMPKWLTSRPDRSDYQKFPPKQWDEYARFVTWYVGKMKHLVKHWEVWNEPVPYAYWMGTIEEMVKLHEVTYKAVKAADPDAVVLGPCPYSFLFPFLEKFFELGGGKWIDAVVIHAYTGGAPEPGELDVNLRKVRELAARHIGPRDLYVTELGWDVGRSGPLNQARYLARAHVLAMEAGVKALIWHMYWDYSGGKGDAGYAILNHNQTPTPALVGYCTLMRLLAGTRFSRRLAGFADPVRAYEFAGGGRKVTVAWCWKGSAKARIPVGGGSVEVVASDGGSRTVAAKDGAVELTLGEDPVYIRD